MLRSESVDIKCFFPALLAKEVNSTVVLVDYWDYMVLDGRRSCNNLRLVAGYLAEFLDHLVDKNNFKLVFMIHF